MSEVTHLIELGNNERMAVAGCGCKANRETYGGKEVILVKACIATPAVWSREKPTMPGWYWWREPEHNNGTPEICHVYLSEGGELRVLWTTDSTFTELLTEYDGEWSGPLRPPVEGKG